MSAINSSVNTDLLSCLKLETENRYCFSGIGGLNVGQVYIDRQVKDSITWLSYDFQRC